MEKKTKTYGGRKTDGNRQARPTVRRRAADGDERPARKQRPKGQGRKSEYEDKPATQSRRRAEYDEKPATRYGRRSDREDKPARYGAKSDYEGKPSRYTRKDAAPARKPAKKAAEPEDGGLVRLNKFIANSGICSRREADTYIETGLVTVNGQKVTELGTKVDPLKDDIRFNGERLRGEKKVYILMNKPKDFVTTLADPHAERTVMDLISPALCPERVYPVGRLDKATTGVLLLTNDGNLAEQLTHPKHEVRKIYQASLDKNLRKEDFDKILEGIELEDGFIAADAIAYVEGDKSQVGLEIHSGRNRIVRRIFEHLGYKVKKLDRVSFAGLTKKGLRRGAWRFLEDKELNLLKMGVYK